MDYEHKRHVELLKHADSLRKQNKLLQNENKVKYLNLQNGFQKFIFVVMNFIPILMKKIHRIFHLQKMKKIFGMLLLISFHKFMGYLNLIYLHPRRFYRPLRALLKWKGVYFNWSIRFCRS